MILNVTGIEEIQVTDISGTDIIVKEGDQFETTDMFGKCYLNNYPQYFKNAYDGSVKVKTQEAKKQEEDKPVNTTVATLVEAIKALGGTPKGNKAELEVQLAELQKAKEEADAKAKAEAEVEATKTDEVITPVETTEEVNTTEVATTEVATTEEVVGDASAETVNTEEVKAEETTTVETATVEAETATTETATEEIKAE